MYRWLDWQKLGDEGANTIAAAQYRDRRFLFASDIGALGGTTSTGTLHVRSIKAATPFSSELDTGWEVFPVGGTTDVAVGPAVFNDKLYVFAKGVDDRQVYVSSTDDDTTWREWKVLPGGGTTPNQVTAVAFNTRLHLFARGVDSDNIWTSSSADGQGWTKWSSPFPALPLLNTLPDLEGTTLTVVRYAVAAAIHKGDLHLLVHDNSGGIHVTSTADGTQWSNWVSVGWTGSSGLAATSFSGGLLVFSCGSDGQLYMKGSSDGTKWLEPWSSIGSPPPHQYARAPVVIGGGASMTLYVLGKDGIFFRQALYEVDTPLDY